MSILRSSKKDEVIELKTLPQSSVGAPLPRLVATEHCLWLLYHLEEIEEKPYSTAIVTFQNCLNHKFGFPNDEVLHGHPLYKKGLRPYAAFEINNSSWRRSIIEMNTVHPRHSSALFDEYKHYTFSFHDSVFECLAEGFTIEIANISLNEALLQVVKDKF